MELTPPPGGAESLGLYIILKKYLLTTPKTETIILTNLIKKPRTVSRSRSKVNEEES